MIEGRKEGRILKRKKDRHKERMNEYNLIESVFQAFVASF